MRTVIQLMHGVYHTDELKRVKQLSVVAIFEDLDDWLPSQ